ncbi:MAG: sigma-70 family RNA polymerase sigma factor [Gemmatimonas sp.]|nr:sigma-70 family RNA polymerase sigma factor [Gemmatimonas sp.]
MPDHCHGPPGIVVLYLRTALHRTLEANRPADGASLSAQASPTEGEFDALYERLKPSLWRYVHRLVGDPDVSDDVVQEAFVRLLKKPNLSENAARLWLFTVATNLVRDRGRTTARRRRLLTAVPVEGPSPNLADRQLEREEQVRAVRVALERLPERDRQLLLMREEGFKYREIAEVIGTAPSSIGTLIARATKRFTEVYRPVEG